MLTIKKLVHALELIAHTAKTALQNEAEKAEKAMDAAAAEPEPVAIKSKPELDDGIDGELVGVTP